MSINEKKLDFWIARNRNVLFFGKHGVGKTSLVIDAFTRAGLNWRYFSAATMDPWVDFIGVPRSMEGENGEQYLDLVRPKEFQSDEVEALFFDEYNRAPKKVRNAVMELIQFKSINGRKFKKLRLIWAAVNPDDDETEEYDVEPLDPAQKDRFHVQIELPYIPSRPYFTDKFGSSLAKAALSWWNGLGAEQKNAVSPRRLDYALDFYRDGGDLRDVLPKVINVSELMTVLESGPVADKLDQLLAAKDHASAEAWLASENNAHAAIPYIIKSQDYMVFFLQDLPDERLSSLIADNEDVLKFAVVALETPKFRTALRQIVAAKQNSAAIGKITAALRKHHKAESIFALATGSPDKPHFKKNANLPYYKQVISKAKGEPIQSTYYRKMHYDNIVENIPEQLDVSDAEDTLDYMNLFCKRSQVKSLQSASNFIGIINHCMNTITSDSNGPQTGVAFWKKYRKRYQDLFNWITGDTKVCERVYNP